MRNNKGKNMSRKQQERDHLAKAGPLVFILVCALIFEFFFWFVPA